MLRLSMGISVSAIATFIELKRKVSFQFRKTEIQCGSKSYIFISKTDANKGKLEVTLSEKMYGRMEKLILLI